MIMDLIQKNRQVYLAVLDDDGTEKDIMTFDAVVAEDHVLDMTVTEHPVESGSVISDHASIDPDALTMDIEISNYPYELEEQFIFVAAKAVKNLLSVGTLDEEDDRAVNGYLTLKKFRDEMTLLRVTTHLEIYDNMLLTSIRIPRDKTTVDTLKATLVFKEVRIVRASYVPVPDKYLEEASRASTSTIKDQGNKPTETTTPAEDAKLKTLGKRLLDSARGK